MLRKDCHLRVNDYDDLNTNASSTYAKGIIPGKKQPVG
jgi:hypothetical protein